MSPLLTATEQAVVIVPHPERECIRVRGSEAGSWLNGLASADIAQVTPAQGVYSLLLNKVGKVQTDLDVVAERGGLLLGVAAGLAEPIAAALNRHLVMEDAELELAPELCWVRLHGARSSEVLRQSSYPGGSIDWLGVGGAAVVVPREGLQEALTGLLELGGPAALLATQLDWKRLRVLRGFPEFGVDYGPEDNPHEASLDRRAVSWSKGCYLGQEVVCMQDLRGKLKRRVTLLQVPSGDALAEQAPVSVQSVADPVGNITSSVVEGSSCFGLARLKAPFFEGTVPLSVAGSPAEIVAQPAR
ncbi:MAG TPA: hypothetical protein VER33_01925 [Polyangiaceae bacterium]|nr:hypothetical protein [Polyangiaceae bacterium]